MAVSYRLVRLRDPTQAFTVEHVAPLPLLETGLGECHGPQEVLPAGRGVARGAFRALWGHGLAANGTSDGFQRRRHGGSPGLSFQMRRRENGTSITQPVAVHQRLRRGVPTWPSA